MTGRKCWQCDRPADGHAHYPTRRDPGPAVERVRVRICPGCEQVIGPQGCTACDLPTTHPDDQPREDAREEYQP